MVVDDQERIRDMVSRMLASEGHSTVSVADGLQALQELAKRDVDLILLDLVMPNSHGMQVLTTLRERGSTTPVIVLSAVTDVSARVQACVRRLRGKLAELPIETVRSVGYCFDGA
jgi:two-component system copper resistance phosphate regulon response regulator CusR